jgi:hypothetical protein
MEKQQRVTSSSLRIAAPVWQPSSAHIPSNGFTPFLSSWSIPVPSSSSSSSPANASGRTDRTDFGCSVSIMPRMATSKTVPTSVMSPSPVLNTATTTATIGQPLWNTSAVTKTATAPVAATNAAAFATASIEAQASVARHVYCTSGHLCDFYPHPLLPYSTCSACQDSSSAQPPSDSSNTSFYYHCATCLYYIVCSRCVSQAPAHLEVTRPILDELAAIVRVAQQLFTTSPWTSRTTQSILKHPDKLHLLAQLHKHKLIDHPSTFPVRWTDVARSCLLRL